MSNPIFNAMGMQGPMGNMAQLAQQFQQFKQNFKGNPQAEVMRMLQSGQITQQQLNQAQQMAQQFSRFLSMK